MPVLKHKTPLLHKNLVNIQKGYTLIELLIGLSVIAIVFSTGFVNFRDFSRRQALIGAAREISGELRLAQEKALSGQKPDHLNCNTPNTLAGFNFRIDSPNSYVIEAVCSLGTVEVKSIELVPSITISTPTPNPILFKVLGQGTNILSGESAVLTLTQTDLGNTLNVSIGATGEIK